MNWRSKLKAIRKDKKYNYQKGKYSVAYKSTRTKNCLDHDHDKTKQHKAKSIAKEKRHMYDIKALNCDLN